ncbi:MAG: bacillithiol biosynthesis cysteine-adding enzyme BshC [Ignavibacteria bacterium]|nr:bacillithiol biosynthesis cysteine-adding enzyme BshC [Ignavibacteria bacterium]
MKISFNLLPDINEIFLDYLCDFSKVKSFFSFDYRSEYDFKKIIDIKSRTYAGNKIFRRNDLADILKTQNKFFNSSETTFYNIEKLKNNNTFAVVTGQQVGLLTGNYYTILKPISTIKLCERLKTRFPDFEFVPVFWMETEDHDYIEINNISVFDAKNELKKIEYFTKGETKERYLTPTGRILIDEHFEDFKKNLRNNILQTEYTEELFEIIEKSYRIGISLGTAFARFFNYIFENNGIIFIDPNDNEIKKLLRPVFEKELNTYPETCEIIIRATAKIEEKLYEPQIKPKPINLFYICDDERFLIEPGTKDAFSLKNTRKKIGKEEMYDLLYKSPENFSPNVVLRPICQDYLLPTAVYIAGPSEIAYFAQLKQVYDFYEIKQPVLYPRVSATILENRVCNFINKYNINYDDLFDEQKIINSVLKVIGENKVEEIFSKFNDNYNSLCYQCEKELSRIDVNLIGSFKNKSQKYLENLEILKHKFEKVQEKKNAETVNKVKLINENIYPQKKLQERIINISYYLNKYGPEFIENLMKNIDIEDFNHQIIEIEQIIS